MESSLPFPRSFDLRKPLDGGILDAARLEVDTFSRVKSRHYYSNCLIKVSHDAKALASLRVINSARPLIKAGSYDATRRIMMARSIGLREIFKTIRIKKRILARVANFLDLTDTRV